MTRKASVAVIGGGVIGASVAYHLAKAGMRDVLILDRAPGSGEGSTGKATGGYRAQFSTAINVQLSLFARDKLLAFHDDTGVDPGYSQVGYLWLASDDRQLGALRAALEVQHAEGLAESVDVSLDDVGDINPAISTEGLAGAAFCPTDGYIKPLAILRGYLEAGARLGVETMWDSPCLGFEKRGDRIAIVRTPSGDIEVETVVNAAGAWAAGIAEMAGFDLPVVPLRRQAAVTYPTSAIPSEMPMTLFLDDGFHARARDGRALVCMPSVNGDPHAPLTHADDDWIDTVAAAARQRIPALADVAVDPSRSYAGLYEQSPDHHAIVGFATECENMFLVNGSSGHGVMHSPALGAIAGDMITGRSPAVDVQVLRPSRFAEGQLIAGSDLL